MSKHVIQCWNCGTRLTLDERSENDGECLECDSELALDDYFEDALTERDELRVQVEAMREAVEFASKSLSQITSSDGSGHSDIALSVLRLAGMNAVQRETLVEGWKAKATWRIDAALQAKP